MVEMLQVKVVLVALLSCALLVQVSTAQRTDMLTETLRGTLKNDKDLVPLLLLKIVSEVIAERAEELLPRPEEEEEGEREQMMRRHLPLSQRERKAGCRNFFWKTFTSC